MKLIHSNHPVFHYSSEIKDICKPLQHLGITYFAHVRIDSQGKFAALNNNPEFLHTYLKNRYYNADIHRADANRFGHFIIWDSIRRTGKSYDMHTEAAAHGIKHTFTMIEKTEQATEYYHFAANTQTTLINQVYLANVDLLKLFTQHFHENISTSPHLSKAYDLQLALDLNTPGYTTQEKYILEPNKKEFLHEIGNTFDIKFTKREIDIAKHLIRGKSAKIIAHELHISQRTVEAYLERMKIKMNVNSKPALIEKILDFYLIIQHSNQT